jgi:hypothetical protein
MPHMGRYGHAYRLRVKGFRLRRTPDPAAVFQASMFGNFDGVQLRTAGIQACDFRRETTHIFPVMLGGQFLLPQSAPFACIGVREACLFRLPQAFFRDQKPLSLISLAGLAPFENDGPQNGMLLGPSAQAGVSGRQKRQVIQIAARQTQRPFVFLQCDPGAPPQVFAALAALGLARGNKHLDVGPILHFYSSQGIFFQVMNSLTASAAML